MDYQKVFFVITLFVIGGGFLVFGVWNCFKAVLPRFRMEKASRITIEDRMAEIGEEFRHLRWAGNGEAKVPISIRLPNFLDRLVEAFMGLRLVFRIKRNNKARARAWRKRGILDDD